jgi:peptide/nickel transport system substrate-binding protein
MAGVMPILPSHLLKDIPVSDLPNSDFARNPIGTGPFILREWNAEESLIFDKNPNYFGGDVSVDTFIWQVIPEPSAQITAFLNNEVDFITVNADDLSQVEGADGVATHKTPGSRYYNVQFHVTDLMLADARTRQAIAHSINRDELLIGVFGGLGEVENCIFHPSLPEYDAALTGYTYDVEAAKELLAEVGWSDQDDDGILEAQGVAGIDDGTKFAIELGSMSSTIYVRMNEMLQQYLKAIGIDVTIVPMESGIYFGEYLVPGSDWQITGAGWNNLIGAPQQELLWNITCDSGSAYEYCNPDLDTMVYANNSIFDPQERSANFYAILDTMQADVVYYPLVRPQNLFAYDMTLTIPDFQSDMDMYRSLPNWTRN